MIIISGRYLYSKVKESNVLKKSLHMEFTFMNTVTRVFAMLVIFIAFHVKLLSFTSNVVP